MYNIFNNFGWKLYAQILVISYFAFCGGEVIAAKIGM